MFPLPCRPGDPVDDVVPDKSVDPRIGGTQCNACVSLPSHRLVPCQHTVCYNHFLAHPEGTPVRCARCLKSVQLTLEIEEVGESALNDLAALTEGMRFSPSNSIWGSPSSSTHSGFLSLDASVASMRGAPPPRVYEHKRVTTTPPAAEDNSQLGATSRGVIGDSRGMSRGPQHSRFPSFNPARPAVANFPDIAASHQQTTSQQQQQQQQSAEPAPIQHSSDNTGQARSPGPEQHVGPKIHSPRPGNFKASQAFRELATPVPMPEPPYGAPTTQQYPVNMQQSYEHTQPSMNMQHMAQHLPDLQQRLPVNTDSNGLPGSRSLLSPVNMQGPFDATAVPGMVPVPTMNFGGPYNAQNAQPPRGPMYNEYQSGFFPGQGRFANGMQMNRPHVGGPQMNSAHFQGLQMNGYQMNGPHMNGPHMNGPHMSSPHMNSFSMNNFPSNGNMPIGRSLPAEADPFVDSHRPMYGNAPFTTAAPTYRPFASAPQSSVPSPVNSPAIGYSNGYTNNLTSRQRRNSINTSQQPQSNAARVAEAIKSGSLEHFDSRSPPRGRGFTSPAPDRPGNELAVQPMVRSQAVMSPDIHPDPDWVSVDNVDLPTLDQVYEHIPFVDVISNHPPSTAGVIKIGNIPYGTTKNEVIAALGRSTRIASQPRGTAYFAIHIIMERSTGKTMDVYVELDTVDEAKTAVAGFQQRCMNNRQPRIGDRHIDIELSSQEELMKELFPRAKCVNWEGHVPMVYDTSEPFNSGFQGFVTSEEMVMITKHAETPQRSPFAQRCVNRTYETMISLMHKYPWHAVSHISVRERLTMVSTAIQQLRPLMSAVNRNSHPQHLHRPLLQEYLTACLSNPGFTVQHKAFIIHNAVNEGFGDMVGFIPYTHVEPLTASWWPFEVLSKKPESSDQLLVYIKSLLQSATDPHGNFIPADKDPNSALELPEPEFAAMSAFGNFCVKYPKQKDLCSLQEAAEVEWRALAEALQRILPAHKAIGFHYGTYSGGAGGSEQQQQAGADEDNARYEGGEVLALPGVERGEDTLLG